VNWLPSAGRRPPAPGRSPAMLIRSVGQAGRALPEQPAVVGRFPYRATMTATARPTLRCFALPWHMVHPEVEPELRVSTITRSSLADQHARGGPYRGARRAVASVPIAGFNCGIRDFRGHGAWHAYRRRLAARGFLIAPGYCESIQSSYREHADRRLTVGSHEMKAGSMSGTTCCARARHRLAEDSTSQMPGQTCRPSL
jgi:hypothetical protein